ncbi:MAG: YfcE family phosphodiesterase [Lachnospiraceae bacterium]
MKKVLIVSDTHGITANLKKVVSRFDRLDLLIHLGDIETPELTVKQLETLAGCRVEAVRGNCDSGGKLPGAKVIALGKYRVFLTHGNLYSVRAGVNQLARAAKTNRCQIAMFGHTHVFLMDTMDGVTVMNPGSISIPYDRVPSYILAEVDDDGELHFSKGTV